MFFPHRHNNLPAFLTALPPRLEQAVSMKQPCLIQASQFPYHGPVRSPRQGSLRAEHLMVPGMAVGGQALPGLDAAAGHSEGSPAAAIQLHQQGFGGILRRLPAVVSPLEHLRDILVP